MSVHLRAHLMETSDGIPDTLSQLGVLQETVCSRGVKWTHAHIHARKGEDAA